MAHAQQSSGVYSPIRLLAAACGLTVIVLLWLGWSIYDSHRAANLANERHYRIEVLRGRILHLDETLTMSARMNATTGDLRWEARYRTFEPQLDAAIREAVAIAPEAYRGAGAAETNAANIVLVEMENRAFDLVRQGRKEVAKLILFSDEYEEQKRLYAHGMAELEADLQRISDADSRSRERGTVWLIAAVILVLLITAGGWLAILRILRRWQARLVASNLDLVGYGKDLTELNATLDQRVRDQTRALRDARDYTDNIIGSMIDMLVVVTPDGDIAKVNAATCSLLGYREEELVGQPASMLFCEEDNIARGILSQDAAYQKPGLRRPLAGEDSIGNIEKSFQTKSGDEIRVLMSSSIMLDNNGQVQGIVCIAQDITESKRLQAERERFNRVIEQSLNEIYIFDAKTLRFVDINYGARRNLGYSMAELREMTPVSIKPKFTMELFTELIAPLRAGTQEKTQFDTVHRRKDGSQYPVEVHVQLLDDDPPVFVAIVLDRTERNAAEALLVDAKATAECANAAKTEFLANMSHEIRTPMTAILGFAENLQDTGLSESERLNCAQTIRRNGEYLLGLINDILDLSKIEAGKVAIERRDCLPCRIVAEVASLMRVRADAKGVPFHIEYQGAIPEYIQSDPTRLRQILINLIGNAIKFTETGTVRLVTRLVDDSDVPCLQFDVIDTGRGMTDEQVAKLFQPFMQADNSTTRKFGGTGLGLTISKRFAELLGGDITVPETELGVGTTFRTTVTTGSLDGVTMLDDPLSATVVVDIAKTVGHVSQSDLRGCRILLAEDGEDNQRLISFFLKKAGANIRVVENGKLALDAALAAMNGKRTGDSERPFDVILMDMQMPLMDGYEATSLLRRKGYTAPIIALTAHAMAGDGDKCINAGCDAYATKPIDRKKLIAIIRAYTSSEDTAIHAPENTPKTLVSELVDDDMLELVELFVGELPDKIAAMEEAIGAQDLAALAALAHQLKGAAGGYGFPSITEAATLLESSAKIGDKLDALAEQTRALAELCANARAATPAI